MFETRTAEMRLHATVFVQDVVVFLPGSIIIRKVYQPIPPAVRIVYRERAGKHTERSLEKRRTQGVPLHLTKHFYLSHAFERGKISWRHTQESKLAC